MGGKPEWLVEAIRARLQAGMPDWLKASIEERAGETSVPPTPTINAVSFPSIDTITNGIIQREGGFVNDPDDPGGATNFGVTIGTMRSLGVDINNDGTVDTEDVKLMTAERAGEIFKKEFFVRPGIDKLPPELQATVFDMQVNSGGNAIKILQRVLNRHLETPLTVDGVIGPNTLEASASVYKQLGSELINEYGVGRRDYYYGLADNREASRKYARSRDGGKGGWIKRAEEFLPQELHLTNEQHNERTSQWG
ncbi:MAG: holin-associated N-acetylmuramidase [Candidatus Thorarchaeota archaeon]|jgi:lysozyme family protein